MAGAIFTRLRRVRRPRDVYRRRAVIYGPRGDVLRTIDLDEPPADPDIGVREPRRAWPDGGGIVLLEPPL